MSNFIPIDPGIFDSSLNSKQAIPASRVKHMSEGAMDWLEVTEKPTQSQPTRISSQVGWIATRRWQVDSSSKVKSESLPSNLDWARSTIPSLYQTSLSFVITRAEKWFPLTKSTLKTSGTGLTPLSLIEIQSLSCTTPADASGEMEVVCGGYVGSLLYLEAIWVWTWLCNKDRIVFGREDSDTTLKRYQWIYKKTKRKMNTIHAGPGQQHPASSALEYNQGVLQDYHAAEVPIVERNEQIVEEPERPTKSE
ncbi:hypothetical protein C8J56DRAFT_898257 [Mycena floridula]|nr:hypothetical protein C8J56DRAFT_898257 [Mycena floridula]